MVIVERTMRALAMRLALAMVLLAGCAAASGHDAQVRELERESREIAMRAKQCVSAAMKRRGDQTQRPDKPGSSTGSQMLTAKETRDRQILKCRAEEARENEELLLRERTQYALEAEQERDRNSLMMILTTSRPH